MCSIIHYAESSNLDQASPRYAIVFHCFGDLTL